MAVYVDELVDHSDSDAACVRRYGPLWCHMVADTVEELHAFAQQIGMRRNWFQGPPKHRLPHYDLVPQRRAVALAVGAVELDYDCPEDVRLICNLRRKYNGLPPLVEKDRAT